MKSDDLDINPKVKNGIDCEIFEKYESVKNEVHEKQKPPELNDTDVEAVKKEEGTSNSEAIKNEDGPSNSEAVKNEDGPSNSEAIKNEDGPSNSEAVKKEHCINISDDDWEEEFEEEDEMESSDDDINASNQLYFCRICWQHFRYKIPLKRHMQRVHQKEKPPVYSCKPCNVGLYTPRKFSEHFKSCPFGYLQKKIFTCQQCGKIFAIQKHLIQHEEAAHNQPKQSFPCSLCGKEFRKQKILNHHISMHKELWQSCKICKKPIRKANDLKKHMLTHENKVPYFCKKCKQGFLEKNHFKKHKKLHKAKNNRNINYENY